MKEIWTCFITIKSAGGGIRSHMIDKPSFTLGRIQDADLPLLASSISRVHLEIEVKGQEIWICDKDSSNGTLINGRPLQGGSTIPIGPEDVIKLGWEEDEYYFRALPKPFELLNQDVRASSLKDAMSDLAKHFEVKSSLQAEKEFQRVKIETERMLTEAKKKAEIQTTQTAIELQNRKQAIEAEISQMRAELQEEITRERLRANRDADVIIAEAQRTIQRDYEESSRRMEFQLAEAQTTAMEVRQRAEESAQKILEEAQEDAVRVRLEASEEARAINKEALKKSEEVLAQLHETFQREVSQKRDHLIAKAKAEAEKEGERIRREASQAIKELEENTEALEKLKLKSSVLVREIDDLNMKRQEAEFALEQLKRDNEELHKKITEVENLEARRDKAEHDYLAFTKSREEGFARVEREIRELREQRILEFDDFRKKQDIELGKERVKALETIQKAVEREEEKYEKTKRLRAIELSQAMYDKLVPNLSTWSRDPDLAPQLVKADIETAIQECFLNQSTSVEMISTVGSDKPVVTAEMRDQKILKIVGLCAIVMVIASTIFREELWRFIQGTNSSTYTSERMERVRAENVFPPAEASEFRESYTDNVLYMKNYVVKKSDPLTVDKWILSLNNDLDLLRSMKVDEEQIRHVVAKESTLVKTLGTMRQNIDRRYLDQSIEGMRKEEAAFTKELIDIMNGRENYEKFRAAEKEFLSKLK